MIEVVFSGRKAPQPDRVPMCRLQQQTLAASLDIEDSIHGLGYTAHLWVPKILLRLIGEADWAGLNEYSRMVLNVTALRRLLTVRNEWSRK